MKRALILAVLAISLILPAPFTLAAMPVPPVPSDGYVLDQTNTLTAEQKTKLNTTITEYRTRTRVQLAILMVPRIENDYLENFSLNVARTWGIGEKGKNNGALLLVALQDHKVRIEVGTGLEGDLTDARAGQIIRNRITPQFKNGDYYKGLTEGLDGMTRAIAAVDDPLANTPAELSDTWITIAGISTFMFISILSWFGAILGRSKRWWPGGVIGGILGGIVGMLLGGIMVAGIAGFILAVIGFILDYFVSKNYTQARSNNSFPSWWSGGTGFGGGSGGGGFSGGFGGGGFSGGGSSGSW